MKTQYGGSEVARTLLHTMVFMKMSFIGINVQKMPATHLDGIYINNSKRNVMSIFI